MAFPPFKPRQSLAARSDDGIVNLLDFPFPGYRAPREHARPGETTGAPPALVPLRGKVYCQGSRFPETATTSLGVFQPLGPCLIKARSPEIKVP